MGRDVTFWLRFAYEVTGRSGKSRATAKEWVSEAVPFEVPSVDARDHPVAMTVGRGMQSRDLSDLRGMDLAAPPGDRQAITLRVGTDGLLCPVLEPGGLTGLRPGHAESLLASLRQARPAPGRIVTWQGYPLAGIASGRPWAHPDEPPGITNVSHDNRAEALDAAVKALAGAVVIDGALWRPCGRPVWAVSMSHRVDACSLSPLIPGHDLWAHRDARELRIAAIAGCPAGMPSTFVDFAVAPDDVADAVRRRFPRMSVRVDEARWDVVGELPPPRTAGLGLRAMKVGFDDALDAVPWPSVPSRARLPLATVQDALDEHDRGGIDEARAEAVLEGAEGALAAGLRGVAPTDRLVDLATLAGMVTLWHDLRGLEERVAPTDDEVAGFSP